MNLLNLTDRELFEHLDKYSEDPVIRRLVSVVLDKEDSVVAELIEAGMDEKTLLFEDCGLEFTPGEYIVHLEKSRDYAQEEMEQYQYKYESEHEERKLLESRSVVDLISDLRDMLHNSDRQISQAEKEKITALNERDEVKSKMKMWTTLASPYGAK